MSFADAEVGEDGLEDFGGGDGAGDGGEVVDGFAEVLGDEVGGKGGVESVGDGAKEACGFAEGVGVALVCDDDVGSGVFSECVVEFFDDEVAQAVDAGVVEG